MKKFNARAIPKEYLRIKFKIASAEETRKLAEAFAPLAVKLFQGASIFNQARIGLKGDIPDYTDDICTEAYSAGKSTFLKALLSKILGYPPQL